MTQHQPKLAKVNVSVDVSALIRLLRSIYKYSSGGISSRVPLDESQVSRMSRSGVGNCSWRNTSLLWNLAIDEMGSGNVTEDQVRACIPQLNGVQYYGK